MNIIGRLTKDAEVRTTPRDKQVVSFSIAANDHYRNKQGERVEQTTYFNCSYWISSTIAQYLTKGSLVEVEGRIGVSAWKDMQGEARANLTVHVNQIKLHGGKSQRGQQPTITERVPPQQAEPVTDDLPF